MTANKEDNPTVELMCPAGNLETAKLAIDSGADAIYAGVTNLSMRPKRVEFSDDDFNALIDYVKSRGKKLYATMNICPKPSDVDNFKRRVGEIYDQGVDAVIVSDVGMMNWIHRNYPKLPIHASIMTSIVNVESAKFYHELGADVVLVSRSLDDLKGLKKIREEAGVDIELFVHGGICYMFDGYCYMSSYWRQEWGYDSDMGAMRLFGQNNTKGECHLICKRECGLQKGDSQVAAGRLMRRHDDVGLKNLPFYLDIGVRILKIEGRAMPAYYIEEATKIYRQAIDLYQSNPEKYIISEEWSAVVERLIEARWEYERRWDIQRQTQEWERRRAT